MYFLFAGETYYPRGGMSDLVGTFPTREAARAAAESPVVDKNGYAPRYDWWDIVMVVDGQLVVVE
jgi:hypothetical protein